LEGNIVGVWVSCCQRGGDSCDDLETETKSVLICSNVTASLVGTAWRKLYNSYECAGLLLQVRAQDHPLIFALRLADKSQQHIALIYLFHLLLVKHEENKS